jgi:hypothetical protein
MVKKDWHKIINHKVILNHKLFFSNMIITTGTETFNPRPSLINDMSKSFKVKFINLQ